MECNKGGLHHSHRLNTICYRGGTLCVIEVCSIEVGYIYTICHRGKLCVTKVCSIEVGYIYTICHTGGVYTGGFYIYIDTGPLVLSRSGMGAGVRA